ncbi:NUDIX domain-containing protein [Streptomyces flavovirens]
MGRHDGQEYWTLPGGGTEPGQSPEDAVIREVAEGTGPEEAVLAPRAPYLGTTSELAPRYVVEGDGLHLASWLMSTSRMPAPAPGTTAPPSSGSRRFVGRLCAAVTLLPRGILAFGAAAAGRADTGRAFLGAGTGSGGRKESTLPGGARVTGHAVLTVLMGALSLVLAALFVLAVARGALYGFVDQGPYDTSWGGPSRAGAWLVHFAAATPAGCAALAAMYGIAGLQRRMTAPLRGERGVRWALPTALVCAPAGTLFVIAFVRQLP